MSERVDAYRRKAAECSRQALLVHDPATRLIFWDLADQWNEMLRSAEVLERLQASGMG